ncbi:MAG: RsmF rRNA methyltransferase first C-terminal domain-containing protein [Candidatus Gastranaerophilales bacterium]|nr:RsmF rRNA methyltransferase first C-terminal domain-containing protein [Candidatus Gastranaerophilales bacterium]
MLPEAFCDRMKSMLGEDYEKFEESLWQDRYQALRLNPLKVTADGRIADAGRMPFALTKVPWAKNGYYYPKDARPGRHPYHEAGVYYIQEPSAMAPVELLEAKPDEKILDLCAAPGGKSTQIAAAMEGRGILFCNEIEPARARILSENIERMGVVNACVTNETPRRLAEVFPAYFDRILVDAPCSGEGMFRKNEDACGEWSLENVQLCAGRQDDILDQAARMLRPGGRLVYSTCTFSPEEDEGSVSRFVRRHPEFVILDSRSVKCMVCGCEGQQKASNTQNFEMRSPLRERIRAGDGIPEWIADPAPHLDRTLRLWPQHVAGEGHYAAVLEKRSDGSRDITAEQSPLPKVEKGVSGKELEEYLVFAKEELCGEWQDVESEESRYIRFGDHVYRIPQECPALKHLKVLRPGLHVGTFKKNRFEPAHALALALPPAKARHVWNLSSEDGAAYVYLSGQTFPAEGEKGWYLICVDGFGLGWGKLVGGTMKNHYPKGLRLSL